MCNYEVKELLFLTERGYAFRCAYQSHKANVCEYQKIVFKNIGQWHNIKCFQSEKVLVFRYDNAIFVFF